MDIKEKAGISVYLSLSFLTACNMTCDQLSKVPATVASPVTWTVPLNYKLKVNPPSCQLLWPIILLWR